MGVWLKIDYLHSANLRPWYLTNAQVEDLAWQVRHQLGCASPWTPKMSLDLLFSIEGHRCSGPRQPAQLLRGCGSRPSPEAPAIFGYDRCSGRSLRILESRRDSSKCG